MFGSRSEIQIVDQIDWIYDVSGPLVASRCSKHPKRFKRPERTRERTGERLFEKIMIKAKLSSTKLKLKLNRFIIGRPIIWHLSFISNLELLCFNLMERVGRWLREQNKRVGQDTQEIRIR